MAPPANLREVSTATLEQLLEGLSAGRVRPPLDRAALVGFGIKHQLDALERAFAGHKSPAIVTVLEVVLAERARPRPSPELVWTGPEAPSSAARDTAVVLRELFEGARSSVILAGYSFDHAHEVLAPLHAAMRDHGVDARFIVDIPQLAAGADRRAHLASTVGAFHAKNWPFGEPFPRLYYDQRALTPGPPFCSMHAKCVVVDGARAFVSSANFTQRGQERNIEVGVLLDDPSFAEFLARQWLGLIESGQCREHVAA